MPAPRISRSLRPRQPHFILVLILALCVLVSAETTTDTDTDSAKPTKTTAPIYLPHYNHDYWDALRGSVISKNATASETTYTIFCPTETPPACDIALEFPFIITGGPSTVKFHGTVTSTYTANVACDLDGTTAATCSGYSSYKSGYSNGLHTGPTEVRWTSTLSGSEVEWGQLTLADKPSRTSEPLGVTITTQSALFESSGDLYYMPEETDEPGAATLASPRGWACSAVVGGLLYAILA